MLSLLTEEKQDLFKLKIRLIGDSYHRMATNRCIDYRKEQMDKCDQWLEEMTKILEEISEQ
jgi:hypothetical protein